MTLSNNDISAQNLRMRDGETSAKDIARHTDAWIKANQATFDGWIKAAMQAAK
jgi:glycine betaine/proline transport system substrate-binding protein